MERWDGRMKNFNIFEVYEKIWLFLQKNYSLGVLKQGLSGCSWGGGGGGGLGQLRGGLGLGKHSQRWAFYLFYVPLHFEPYWKQENLADINFLVLHSQIIARAFQQKFRAKFCGWPGQIFQVWPYLNLLIIIKLPFLQQKHVQISPLPLPSKTCALPFDFTLERDPKNICYY